MAIREETPTRATHEVANQPPPLVDYNAFEQDAALREGLGREGAGWALDRVRAIGAIAGSAEAIRWGFQANEHPPKLLTHDRYGNRIDEVEFHPAWHELLSVATFLPCRSSTVLMEVLSALTMIASPDS